MEAVMRVNPLLAFLIFLVLQTFAVGVYAQGPLNDIKLGACGTEKTLGDSINIEQRRGLVIDARPFAINQSTGKASFNGKSGRVSVLHMNPFIYRYDISVAQQELVSSAVTDFIEILLPPGLRIGSRAQQQAADAANKSRARIVQQTTASSPIARRLGHFDPVNCANANDPGCVALKTMHAEFLLIRDTLNAASLEAQLSPPPFVEEFKSNLVNLRNEEANAFTTCTMAQNLNTSLNKNRPANYLNTLGDIGNVIDQITLNANDLSDLADKYSEDAGLKDYIVRCDGFNCVTEFKDYATAVLALLRLYRTDLEALTATAQAMKRAFDLTEQMKTKNGVFARTFEVPKKFELTEATISITRTKLEEKAKTPGADAAEEDGNQRIAGRNHATNADGPAIEDDDKEADKKKEKDKEKEKEAKKDPSPDVNETIQIGRPRFLLSGGLVFSPLRREAFDNIKGFALDANGNPTGDGNKNVVGFTENSPRRLMPMVMLNSRITSFSPTSLYFSLGVTAKHDDNVDVEYLLGPSISLLNERALFTFGGYVGKVQHLVPDVKIGDEIPDSAGDDAKLFTKRYSWKPGFSFTYVFSDNQRGEGFVSSGSGGGGSADLKNEIRIGGIPFNLAMGLAYTSLEERTYDAIVGFARDRDGKLTNGEKLTRIVGLTSSSGYRLAPLALLHTRLFDFGNRSFYFSTGVTGKKNDDKVEIEYLLGGTVNAYRRKIFVTFGAFAGKQNVLGGNFFTGQQLDKDQSVTTTSRYVWKPAFAISYDITRILKKDSQ